MSFTVTVDHDHRRVVAKAEGPITVADVRAHLDEERAARGLSYGELIDARGAVPSFTPADVRAIVDLLCRLAEESRLGPTAVVIDSDVGYGMLRMLGILVDLDGVSAIEPFRRQEEAERWLAEQTARPS